jgi:hypothetical protein
VIETLANKALAKYEPSDAEKLEKYHGALQQTARKHNIAPEGT